MTATFILGRSVRILSEGNRILTLEVEDGFYLILGLTASVVPGRRNFAPFGMPTKRTIARNNYNSAMYGCPILR